MIEPTDENTGLPPLDQPVESDTLWVAAFTAMQADAMSPLDGSPQGCLVLCLRGVWQGMGITEWAQFFAAIPHGGVTSLRNQLDDYLMQFPEYDT